MLQINEQFYFLKLYDEARAVIAEEYNRISQEENEQAVSRLRDRLDRSDRFYEEEKQLRLKRAESERKIWTAGEITEI